MNISATVRKYRVFILVGIFLWIAWAVCHPLEPRYQGKRLSAWVDDLNPNSENDIQMQEKAVEALRHIGMPAVRLALKLCRAKETSSKESLKEKLEEWLGKQKLYGVPVAELYGFHQVVAENPHAQSWEIFAALGSIGKPAIPSLIKLLGNSDRDVADTASSDLVYIGSDTIPSLINVLTNHNAQIRENAAVSLGGLGESFRQVTEIKGTNGGVGYAMGAVQERFKPQIQPVLPALLQCLKDEDRRVRSAAAFALMQCDADPSSAVPALIAALEKETNYSMSEIFYALGHYKTNASAAVPLLLKIVKLQQRPLPINDALNALHRIDPEAAKQFIEKWKASITSMNAIPTNVPTSAP